MIFTIKDLLPTQSEIEALKQKYITPCTICGGSRKIIENNPEFRKVSICQCVKKFNEEYVLACANIPMGLRHLTKNDIAKDFIENNKDNWNRIAIYSTKLREAYDNGAGLFIHGENGAGKSFAATLILKRALKDGYTAYFVLLRKLIKLSFDALEDQEVSDNLEKLITEIDFLVIDELDKVYQDKNDMVYNMLENLFKQRYYSKKPLIVTSNVAQGEIHKIHGDMAASTFSERMFPITLIGNYRPYIIEKLEREFFDAK